MNRMPQFLVATLALAACVSVHAGDPVVESFQRMLDHTPIQGASVITVREEADPLQAALVVPLRESISTAAQVTAVKIVSR